MNTIFSAQVYLDDDVPEYMEGVIRVGSLEFFDEEGETVHNVELNNSLVDNAEFREPIELLEYIARKLGIDSSQIEIIE